MEYETEIPAHAVDLATARKTLGRLNVNDAAEIVRQIAAALAVVHSKSIVHRDIKPANVLLVGGDAPNVQIIDFGIAKNLTEPPASQEGIAGTPLYMPPEAFASSEVTPAADVFSLGVVLAELISGDLPSSKAQLTEIVSNPSARIDETLSTVESSQQLPTQLSSLLRRMLDPSPSNRPTATAVAEALNEFTGD